MHLKQLLGVVVEPITLDEAKAALREYSDHEDGRITQLITAGRQWAEDYTGCSWAVQHYVISLDGLPREPIKLPYPPLASLDKITYVAADGAQTTGSVEDWRVDLIGSTVTPGASVPAGACVLEYTAGGQIIPEVVKQAILLYVKATYEDIPGSEWQPQAERMLYPYKELRV